MRCFKTGEATCPKFIFVNPQKVFVGIASESREAGKVYQKIILPVLKDLNWSYYRADEDISNIDIMCKICEQVQSSGWVFILTAENRHNVFLELGLAYGVSRRVVILKEKKQNLPSDLQGLEYLEYQLSSPDIEEAKEHLKNLIENSSYPYIFKSNFEGGSLAGLRMHTPNYKVENNSLILGEASPRRENWKLGVVEVQNCKIRDFTIEATLKIIDTGGYDDNWVGYKIRAFYPGLPGGGYTIYLRKIGRIEVQPPEGDKIIGMGECVPPTDLVKVKSLVQDDTLTAWVENQQVLCLKSALDHRGAGSIYLMTGGTKSIFREVEIYHA